MSGVGPAEMVAGELGIPLADAAVLLVCLETPARAIEYGTRVRGLSATATAKVAHEMITERRETR